MSTRKNMSLPGQRDLLNLFSPSLATTPLQKVGQEPFYQIDQLKNHIQNVFC